MAEFSFAPAGGGGGGSTRRMLYAGSMSQLRLLMVSRMAKPEEVLIVEDENGNIVRETLKDNDVLVQYKIMRETLIYLSHLDHKDTETQMLEKLSNQLNGKEYSWNVLNTLCWAIGSISGSMAEDQENRFLVTAIRDLLNLCEITRGKDHKAVIASNIMYVVGQYPRFLRALHWKFLKTVVNKLFEFMHETHPGVQDMACDTFLKIAIKCKRKFVIMQVGEHEPFVDELLRSIGDTIRDLEPHQIHTFYEAVGHMIALGGEPGEARGVRPAADGVAQLDVESDHDAGQGAGERVPQAAGGDQEHRQHPQDQHQRVHLVGTAVPEPDEQHLRGRAQRVQAVFGAHQRLHRRGRAVRQRTSPGEGDAHGEKRGAAAHRDVRGAVRGSAPGGAAARAAHDGPGARRLREERAGRARRGGAVAVRRHHQQGGGGDDRRGAQDFRGRCSSARCR